MTRGKEKKNKPADSRSLKQVRRVKIKRSDAKNFNSQIEKQILMTETVGLGDMIVLHIETEKTKHGGFMTPLSKESFNDSFELFDEDNFNCHSSSHLFLCKTFRAVTFKLNPVASIHQGSPWSLP